MLYIDASQGEGGGQILRTSLSMAMLTGTDIKLENIRSGRAKPGLMRQHSGPRGKTRAGFDRPQM